MKSENDNVKAIINLLLEIDEIRGKIKLLGEEIYGDCFEEALYNKDVDMITIYTDSGHDWECDEWHYDVDGNEIDF